MTLGLFAAVNVAALPAQAAAPAAPVITPTAPRTNADSGPANLALLQTDEVTTTTDGSVVYVDRGAQQIRKVDAGSHTISVVAGSGQTLTHGPLDTTGPARDAALPEIDGLWTTQTGDLYVSTCVGSNCQNGKDLYRLDATEGRWHLALHDPYLTRSYQWYHLAVTRNGDVIITDDTDSVIRRVAAGASPNSLGTIVAGKPGSYGASGDGGPATSATISASGPIAAGSSGDFVFAAMDGGIRRVDAQGVITTVVDHVAPTTMQDGRWKVGGLAVSADGATVYAEAEGDRANEIRAFPLDGSAARIVAGPSPGCNSGTQSCIYRSIVEAHEDGVTVVLNAYNSIQSWPADGSDPTRYHQFAGILNDVLGPRSPDGTRLDQAYLAVLAAAESPTGTYALAARDGIHTLSGLSPDSTLSTLAPGVVAASLQYADDGSLYALVAEPLAHVVRITPSGTVTTVFGGGTVAPAVGVAATDVAFSYATSFVLDPATGTILFSDSFVTGDSVWELEPGAATVSAYAAPTGLPAAQPVGFATTADHSTLVGYSGSLYRVGADGDVTQLCHGRCPADDVHQLANGTIVGMDSDTIAVLGADGTVEELPYQGRILTVTAGGRGLTGAIGAASGLLALTGPPNVPTALVAPAVQVTADPTSSITVRVTRSDADQEITVLAGPQSADGTWSTPPQQYSDATTDGMASTFVLRHVFTTWPAAAGAVTPAAMRIEITTSEPGDATHDTVINAQQVLHATPRTDAVATAAPSLAMINGDNSVYLKIGRPTDADFDRVIVCKTVGTIAATDPHSCDVVAAPTSVSSFPDTELQYIDPRVATTFTAFAVDDSGNVSSPVSVTRPAPGLVAGPAVNQVYLRAGPGVERVYWAGDWAAQVRYASGSTPPATLTDGTLGGQFEDGGGYPDKAGYFTELPVAPGHTVSVSIFNYADSNLDTYRRTSLTIMAGTTSDTATLTGSTRVAAGAKPVLRLRLVRKAPVDGTAPLAKQRVQLFSRTVGTTRWAGGSTGVTAGDGSATFVVTAPSRSTQYCARITASGPVVQSAVVTTSVVQTMSIHAPKRVKRNRVAVITGSVAPRHATRVYLQRYVHRHWSTVARTSTVRGAYRIDYRLKTAGSYVLRTVVNSEPTLLGTHSATRTIRVR